MFLIRVILVKDDREAVWEGFLPDAGEPVEFETFSDAMSGAAHVLDGTEIHSLFDAWDSDESKRPEVRSVEIVEVLSRKDSGCLQELIAEVYKSLAHLDEQFLEPKVKTKVEPLDEASKLTDGLYEALRKFRAARGSLISPEKALHDRVMSVVDAWLAKEKA